MAEASKPKVASEAKMPEEMTPEPETTEYVEYLGEKPYGVEFLTSHTIPKNDTLWKRSGVEATKDVTWERDPMGPGIGQKGNRMLVKTADLPDGARAVLEKTPGFKIVNE